MLFHLFGAIVNRVDRIIVIAGTFEMNMRISFLWPRQTLNIHGTLLARTEKTMLYSCLLLLSSPNLIKFKPLNQRQSFAFIRSVVRTMWNERRHLPVYWNWRENPLSALLNGWMCVCAGACICLYHISSSHVTTWIFRWLHKAVTIYGVWTVLFGMLLWLCAKRRAVFDINLIIYLPSDFWPGEFEELSCRIKRQKW